MTESITIHKLDAHGHEVWAYAARLLARGDGWITVEAAFDRQDVDLHGLMLRRGDRMVERFFADRWYNVFAIHDGDGARLKGWYCNITRPARLLPADVFAEDLALDLLVLPDGSSRILDEDEFEALGLPEEERAMASAAMHELQGLGARLAGPFRTPPNHSAPA